MNMITSLDKNISNPYETVSPIDNGYIPINARTIKNQNNDFYVNIKENDLKTEEKTKNNDYLETLKEQIEFSQRERKENSEVRKKELMEEAGIILTDKIKQEAIETYQTMAKMEN